MGNWYQQDTETIITKLATNAETGLDHATAAARLWQYGPNTLSDKEKKSLLIILFNQLKEVMVIILIAAAIISMLLHEVTDGIVILIIVFLNTILGFWQEAKAEYPFSSERKRMTTIHQLTEKGREQLRTAIPNGNLLLALLPAGKIAEPAAYEKELIYLGLAGMIDPVRQILWQGLLVALLSLGAGLLVRLQEQPPAVWRTMVFTTLTCCQMIFALCTRSFNVSLFKLKLFSNLPLLLAIASTLILQLLLIYTPFLQAIFKTVPLAPFQLALCAGISLIIILGTEIEKFILRRISAS